MTPGLSPNPFYIPPSNRLSGSLAGSSNFWQYYTYRHVRLFCCPQLSLRFFSNLLMTLLRHTHIQICVRESGNNRYKQRFRNKPLRIASRSDTSLDPNRHTFRLPSAVSLTRLHDAQKWSVMDVMKDTVPLWPGTRHPAYRLSTILQQGVNSMRRTHTFGSIIWAIFNLL